MERLPWEWHWAGTGRRCVRMFVCERQTDRQGGRMGRSFQEPPAEDPGEKDMRCVQGKSM